MEHWTTYTDGTGNQLLQGNSNTYLSQTSQLHPPIIASRVRFIPYSQHPRTVCMRVELYGCPYTEGLVSYSMRDGDVRYGEAQLRDLTYDGERRGAGEGGMELLLVGGLGQLTDGEMGHTNFRVDALGKGKGYEWVGWEDDGRRQPLEITFQFDSVRNFSALHVYTNNFFTKDTQVFSRARVLFSVGGLYYHVQTPVEVEPEVDRIFENARNVTLHLHHTPAKFVKLQLYFTLRWLLISEVTFDSVPCRCNITEEEKPNATLSVMEGHVFDSHSSVKPSDSDFPSGLLIGGLATLGVVFGVVPVVLFLLYYRSRISFHGSEKTLQSGVTSPKDRKVSMKMKDLHINLSLASVSNGYSRANGKLYGHVAVDDEAGSSQYQEPYKTRLASSHHSLGTSTEYTDTMVKRSSLPHDASQIVDYAVPDINMTPPPPFSEIYKPHVPLPTLLDEPQDQATSTIHDASLYPFSPPIPPPPMQQYVTASEFDHISSIQGVTGTVLYGETEGTDTNYERPVPEMSRHRLHSLEILGEGAFGVVRLCRIDDETSSSNNISSGSRLVLMKQLEVGAKEITKKEFHREIQIMSRVDDPSVTRLIGTVTRSEPLSMLMEYMTCGDLHQFLRRHNCQDMDGGGYVGSERPLISYGGLIHIAVQVASGMRHLENLNLTHRDLAARNCLVDRCLNIKISDMAMSRPMYSQDYCQLGEDNVLLPIRWMSWESLLQGRFTSKSDVWSFGVTLWEILTMARHQPYTELSDDGVLENLSHCCPGGPSMTLLPQPHLCSREMYDLMTACWRPSDRQRPPFWQVLMFLQRKHLGYTLDYP
ncbi:hypothetical protein Pmani_017193 [Petrolisthes manimaculis]|uniref:Uncharacterized protein n=1 Tax=Petrolisthes manimaculis TaxID=1843537 RepID=A0AAE1UA52_9EUCA|nr:hypothetical protein Pmani_017193 [Petrolisthes manimaculis]